MTTSVSFNLESNTMVSKFKVEKFDGSNNFSLWKLKVKALLVLQGLAPALEGKENLPATLAPEKKEDIMVKAWRTIRSCLANNVLQQVKEKKTPDSLWKALEEKYSTNTLSNRLHQRRRMRKFKYLEDKSMKNHIEEFNRMICDVRAAGIRMDDIDQVAILWNSLSPSYDDFFDTILYGRSEISIEEVKEALLIKEEQKLESESKRRSERKSKTRSKSQKLKMVTCYHCHQTGHIRRNCPKREEKSRIVAT